MARVILFHTAKKAAQAVRVHDAACPLVSAARASKGLVRVIEGELFDDGLADFQERGFKVASCKCAK